MTFHPFNKMLTNAFLLEIKTSPVSNVQINVQEDVFSQEEIEHIKEEDTFIIVPIKEQKERGELTESDFYDIGILVVHTSLKLAVYVRMTLTSRCPDASPWVLASQLGIWPLL